MSRPRKLPAERGAQPEIDEPEVAFPQYAKTVAEYLSEAGVQPA